MDPPLVAKECSRAVASPGPTPSTHPPPTHGQPHKPLLKPTTRLHLRCLGRASHPRCSRWCQPQAARPHCRCRWGGRRRRWWRRCPSGQQHPPRGVRLRAPPGGSHCCWSRRCCWSGMAVGSPQRWTGCALPPQRRGGGRAAVWRGCWAGVSLGAAHCGAAAPQCTTACSEGHPQRSLCAPQLSLARPRVYGGGRPVSSHFEVSTTGGLGRRCALPAQLTAASLRCLAPLHRERRCTPTSCHQTRRAAASACGRPAARFLVVGINCLRLARGVTRAWRRPPRSRGFTGGPGTCVRQTAHLHC